MKNNFSAELSGSLNDSPFSMTVRVENCEGGRSCTLVYITPEILKEVEIKLLFTSAGEAQGTAEIRSPDGTLYTVNAAAIEGLCAPVKKLMESAETATVRKTETGYAFTNPDGAVMLLSEDGTPRSFFSETLMFEIVWWQVNG